MDLKQVIIIQCDISHRRCSGFACMNSFYEKDGAFEKYEDGIRYISFTCGGCCGKGVAAKLEHFSKRMRKAKGMKKDEMVIHLSSCMTTDNHHYDRCPHIDYIKGIIEKHGFKNVVEGTYFSNNSSRKRDEGVYKTY